MLDNINVWMLDKRLVSVRLNFDNCFLDTRMICLDMCYKHIALQMYSVTGWACTYSAKAIKPVIYLSC